MICLALINLYLVLVNAVEAYFFETMDKSIGSNAIRGGERGIRTLDTD